jgi:putative hemolysin
MSLTLAIVIGVLLLCASAVFSASETALFSLQRQDLEGVDHKGGPRVRRLLDSPRDTLASILIGNETVNIALSTLTAGVLLKLFPDKPWINVVVLAPVLLVFGEVLPKTLAFRLNRQLAPRLAGPLWAFSRLVSPLRFILGRIAEAALVLTGGTKAPQAAALREAHLRALVDQGRETGHIRPMEQEILHNVFAFGEHTVNHLMTPQADMVAVNLLTPWNELLETVQTTGHSRIPIWHGTRDNIVGILVAKRLLPLMQAGRTGESTPKRRPRQPSPRDLQQLLHSAHFVPTTKRADDLLSEFQDKRFHMAVVVDEHGGVVGVVTLDDLLNELVGEVHDETDKEDPAVTPLGQLRYRVRGDMSLLDFSERFHIATGGATDEVVSDFIRGLLEANPERGHAIEWAGVRFVIASMDGDFVTAVVLDVEHQRAEDDPTQDVAPPDTEEST